MNLTKNEIKIFKKKSKTLFHFNKILCFKFIWTKNYNRLKTRYF